MVSTPYTLRTEKGLSVPTGGSQSRRATKPNRVLRSNPAAAAERGDALFAEMNDAGDGSTLACATGVTSEEHVAETLPADLAVERRDGMHARIPR